MKQYRSNSEGLTFISIMIVLAVLAFFILLILKIGPIYYDNSLVKQSFAKLKAEPELLSMSKMEIKSSIDKRFNVSYVNDVDVSDVIITKRGNQYLKVALDYEVVENIIGNLDVLVRFSEGFEVGEH